jgi:4-oxalocrotonate tautomerase
MPVVTIQITREGTKPGADAATPEEKAALIAGASRLLLDVLDKPLEATFVVIDEVETENWGWGGLPVEQYRAVKRARESA